jgi:hypothetical protein
MLPLVIWPSYLDGSKSRVGHTTYIPLISDTLRRTGMFRRLRLSIYAKLVAVFGPMLRGGLVLSWFSIQKWSGGGSSRLPRD